MTSSTASVRAAVFAGIVGNITISIYLSIALPLFFRTPPLALFQWDASNIVGGSAFAGGWSSAGLGFFFDFIVSGFWAAGFVLLYKAIPILRRATIASGLLYGVLVWLVMFFIIVPLGRAQHPGSAPSSLLNAIVAHTVFFGLPLAFVVRKTLRSDDRR